MNAWYPHFAWASEVVRSGGRRCEALSELLRTLDPNEYVQSRTGKLDEIMRSLEISPAEAAAAEASDARRGGARPSCPETTAVFNHVVSGRLSGGLLGFLVGTTDGRPIPRSDAQRIELIVSKRAMISWLTLDIEGMVRQIRIQTRALATLRALMCETPTL